MEDWICLMRLPGLSTFSKWVEIDPSRLLFRGDKLPKPMDVCFLTIRAADLTFVRWFFNPRRLAESYFYIRVGVSSIEGIVPCLTL